MNERSDQPRPDAPDEQTGRLLDEWLRDEAPAHEPPVLVPTVRARIALTRRRPAFLIRDWWRWRPGRTDRRFPQMNTATQLAAVAVLALSGFGLFMVAGTPDSEPVAPAVLDPSEVLAPVTGSTSGFNVQDAGDITYRDDGLAQTLGMRFEGPWTLSDPRLSGATWSVHDSVDTGPYDAGGIVCSGIMGIENDEGTWTGTFRGYETPGVYEDIHYFAELTGAGGHEGLSAVLFMLDQGSDWDIQGMIYAGEPLPYPEAD